MKKAQPNSWLLLEAEAEKTRLPEHLRELDPFKGRDVGWVEQMIPFIREFSKPGDTVLDPFAGLGSTLVAAAIEQRRGLGFEIEPLRVSLMQRRLEELDLATAEMKIMGGDALQLTMDAAPSSVDLCISNIPYFGCKGFAGSEQTLQCYETAYYANYLSYLSELLKALKRVIKPAGYLIFMAENIRKPDGTLLPLAWDVAKLLAARFQLFDERLLLYKKPSESGAFASLHTNRAHEYALIAKVASGRLDWDVATFLLKELKAKEIPYLIFGGAAKWLQSSGELPSDIDLLVPRSVSHWNAIVKALADLGYELFSWHQPLPLEEALINAEALLARGCLRGVQVSRESICQVDVCFIDADDFFKLPVAGGEWQWVTVSVFLGNDWRPLPDR